MPQQPYSYVAVTNAALFLQTKINEIISCRKNPTHGPCDIFSRCVRWSLL